MDKTKTKRYRPSGPGSKPANRDASGNPIKRVHAVLSGELAARDAALDLIEGVATRQRSVDQALDAAVEKLESRDRGFTRMLVATTLRRSGQIDAILDTLMLRPPPRMVRNILRLGVAQLLFLRTPPHAAINTTVDLVKHRGEGKLAGLVNAVLRRAMEQGPAALAAQDEARLNTPTWLWESWTRAYGEPQARAMALAHLSEPTLDLTVKEPAHLEEWAQKLEAQILPTGSLRRTALGRVQDMPGFAEGAWWVQDAAAALPAKILLHALGDAKDKVVIDLCAAPGGKTLQLAAAGSKVTAVDSKSGRLDLLRDNLERMKLQADVVQADALGWRPPLLADAVLLDAPCSATGTITRHPDLPFLKKPEDVAVYATRQKALLASAAAMVKPGGVVVYSVCSQQPEECEQVVDAVIAENPKLQRAAISAAAIGGEASFITPQGDLRTLSSAYADRGGLDGFYTAVLRVAA